MAVATIIAAAGAIASALYARKATSRKTLTSAWHLTIHPFRGHSSYRSGTVAHLAFYLGMPLIARVTDLSHPK